MIPLHYGPRMAGAFSPMPAVKTKRLMPPIARRQHPGEQSDAVDEIVERELGAGIRVHGLFDHLKKKGIHVATVTVVTLVSPGSKDADAVAEHFWQLHIQPRGSWTAEMQYPAK
jgi:hypothetical protein